MNLTGPPRVGSYRNVQESPNDMADRQSADAKLAIIQNDLKYVREDVAEIKRTLQENYVTKDQFQPVKRIAYGIVTLVGAVLVSAMGYIITSTAKTK